MPVPEAWTRLSLCSASMGTYNTTMFFYCLYHSHIHAHQRQSNFVDIQRGAYADAAAIAYTSSDHSPCTMHIDYKLHYWPFNGRSRRTRTNERNEDNNQQRRRETTKRKKNIIWCLNNIVICISCFRGDCLESVASSTHNTHQLVCLHIQQKLNFHWMASIQLKRICFVNRNGNCKIKRKQWKKVCWSRCQAPPMSAILHKYMYFYLVLALYEKPIETDLPKPYIFLSVCIFNAAIAVCSKRCIEAMPFEFGD